MTYFSFRLLENLNLFQVFEALKLKGDGATPFQWRKLRETCLISKSLKDKEASNKFITEGNSNINTIVHYAYCFSL